MQFDFKITVWERVTVPSEKEAEILELIKSGEITSAQDIYDHLGEDADLACIEKLFDTETPLTVADNEGYATIDVIGDGGESLFRNGKI